MQTVAALSKKSWTTPAATTIKLVDVGPKRPYNTHIGTQHKERKMEIAIVTVIALNVLFVWSRVRHVWFD